MKLFNDIYRWCVAPRHLFVITIAALSLPNIVLCVTENMSVAAKVCNLWPPVAAYWLAMTFSRKPGRMVWWLFPLVFLAAFQLVLTYLFGRSVIAVDMFLNLVTTNPGEAFELLDKIAPSVVMVVVIYVPLLVIAICSSRGGSRLDRGFVRRQRKAAAAVLAAGVAFVGATYIIDEDYRIENDTYPVNVCYNLVLAVERTGLTARHGEMSAGFRFDAESERDPDTPEIYVLVIGETARAMNFGIYGYVRNTTPRLAKVEGLTAFPHAMTQSNTTHKSVPMLMSAASAVDFDRIYREKGIMTAFREAGFHTAFFSNQKPNHSFIDILGEEADECVFVKNGLSDDADISDLLLLGQLDRVLREGKKKVFVALHCYGSHFNYRERYDRSDAIYLPDGAMEAKAANRNDLINAYDNTISLTDKMLYLIIERLERRGALAAMLYTSDHGENIFDDSRNLFLHASPVPSYYDMHVPFMVWTSSEFRSAFPDISVALANNRLSDVENSVSVFHTMLGLAGLRTPYYADSLSVASKRYRMGRRHYLNDHNKAVTIDKLGLDIEDLDMMHKAGISR